MKTDIQIAQEAKLKKIKSIIKKTSIDEKYVEYKNNYELFVLNYNMWLILLGWFLLILFFIYLRLKTDRFRMFIRRRFARLAQEKFIGVDSALDNELENEKNKVNITDIKEKYQKLIEKMPNWYSNKAFKFYYRDVYLLDKKLFDFYIFDLLSS